MPATQAPYSQYFDKNGQPLDAGYVWFGLPNENPKTSPVNVYWDADLTQPASQPIRTLAGYLARNGSPAQVFTDGAYSQIVENKRFEMVYYAANSADYSDLPIRVAVITATDGQTLINLPFSYTRGNNSLAIYLNGILLIKDRDYTETSTTSVTMIRPLKVGPGGADEVTAIGGRLINAASAIDAVSAAALAAGSGAGLVGYNSSLIFPANTVGEKLKETVSVKDSPFDATGDGVTNDYDSLQAATTAVPVLLYPDGAYRSEFSVAAALSSLGGAAWVGQGKSASSVDFVPSSNSFRQLVVQPSADLTVKDMTVSFSGQAGQTALVFTQNANGLTLDGVKIDGGVTHVSGNAPAYTAHGIAYSETGTAEGLSLLPGSEVTRSTFGVLKTNTATSTQRRIRMLGVDFHHNYQEDASFNSPNGVMDDITVADSTFRDGQGKDANGIYQLHVSFASNNNIGAHDNRHSGEVGEAIHLEEAVRNFAIQGNTGQIDGTGFTLTANNVGGTWERPEQGSAIGNHFTKTGTAKEASSRGFDVTFTANPLTAAGSTVLLGNTAQGFDDGFQDGSKGEDAVILAHNVADGCATGFRTTYPTSNVRGNVSVDCDVGVRSFAGGLISDHTFIDNTTNAVANSRPLVLMDSAIQVPVFSALAGSNTLVPLFPLPADARLSADITAVVNGITAATDTAMRTAHCNWNGVTFTESPPTLRYEPGGMSVQFQRSGGNLVANVFTTNAQSEIRLSFDLRGPMMVGLGGANGDALVIQPQKPVINVAAIQSVNAPALGLVTGDVLIAQGRAVAGDVNFGFPFLVESSGPANGGTVFDIGGGLFARLIYSGVANVRWWDDGAADNSAFIQTANNAAAAINFPPGDYPAHGLLMTVPWTMQPGARIVFNGTSSEKCIDVSGDNLTGNLIVSAGGITCPALVDITGDDNKLSSVVCSDMVSPLGGPVAATLKLSGDNNTVAVVEGFNLLNTGNVNDSSPQMVTFTGDGCHVGKVIGRDVQCAVISFTTGSNSVGEIQLRGARDNGVYGVGVSSSGKLTIDSLLYDGDDEPFVVTAGCNVAIGSIVVEKAGNAAIALDDSGVVEVGSVVLQNGSGASAVAKLRSSNTSSESLRIGSVQGVLRGANLYYLADGTIQDFNIGTLDVTFEYDAAIATLLSSWANCASAASVTFGQHSVRFVDINDVLSAGALVWSVFPASLVNPSSVAGLRVSLVTSTGVPVPSANATFRASNLIQAQMQIPGGYYQQNVGPYLREFDGTVPNDGNVYVSSVPTLGTWKKGQIVWNMSPTATGVIGWQCLTEGTPGAWTEISRSIGAIWTPTVTAVTNLDSATGSAGQYARVGSTVTVSGVVTLDATAVGAVVCRISLPVASNFSSSLHAAGTATAQDGTFVGVISADATNDELVLTANATVTSARNVSYSATYRVI